MMVNVVLLVGRLLLIVLLYLFLFAVMRTGVGLVKGQNKKAKQWSVAVERGPKELRGVKFTVTGPLVVGRSAGADIVIGNDYVSGRHARFTPTDEGLQVEDLDSTNGTKLNGEALSEPTAVNDGDIVTVGDVDIRVNHS